jgi:hypothetical protein
MQRGIKGMHPRMKKMSKEEENADVVMKQLNMKTLGKQLYRNQLGQGKRGGGGVYCATSPLPLIVPLSHRLVASHIWAKYFLRTFPPVFLFIWVEK